MTLVTDLSSLLSITPGPARHRRFLNTEINVYEFLLPKDTIIPTTE